MPRAERYEAVIGIEVHCQLRDGLEDVLRLLDGLRRRPAEQPRLPGLPRPARARCPVINRRPSSTSSRPALAIEAHDPRRRPAGTARTTSTRTCPRATRSASTTCRSPRRGRLTFETSGGPVHGRHHPGPPRGGHGQAHPRDGRRRAARSSLVDFNRSGAPLMEIVTEPDIRTAEQARRYAEELQLLLRTIGASDADMERGQMRVEANVSLRPRGTEPFGTRVEVKNMNSFRSVERAIAFEIERQAAALDAGEPLRHGDPRLGRRPRRDLPHARQGDVRRLPLLPGARPAAAARRRRPGSRGSGPTLPELPAARRARYQATLGLSAYDAAVLVADPDATRAVRGDARRRARRSPAKAVANWVTGDYLRLRNAGRRTPRRGRRRPSSPTIVARGRRGSISRAQRPARSSRRTPPTGDPADADHRRRAASARSPTPGALGAGRRRGPRGQPGGRRRLPRRQGPGRRVPRRPGHEGDPRPGQRRARAGARCASGSTRPAGEGRRWAPINLVLWVAGVVLIVVGYAARAGPWARYQALKEQDANVARYEAWRGGVRDDGTTGASVAMEILRRQAQIGGARSRSRVRAGLLRLPDQVGRGRALGPPAGARGARSPCSDPSPPTGPPVGDPGRLPVHDAELEPQAARARRDRLAGRAARTARSAGRRRRCRTDRSPSTASASVAEGGHARGPRARSG